MGKFSIDLFTVYEEKGRLQGVKLACAGDGNNAAHSLLYGCSKMGVHISIACPKGAESDPKVVSQAREEAKRTG
jgi:ornithine carbamoyltransferase